MSVGSTTIRSRTNCRILSEANGPPGSRKNVLIPIGNGNGNLPRDKERNAVLVELTDPRRELVDLVLSSSVRDSLDRIVLERRRADVLESHGMQPTSKVLFCGPPGCGKSVAAESLARELPEPLRLVRLAAIRSEFCRGRERPLPSHWERLWPSTKPIEK